MFFDIWRIKIFIKNSKIYQEYKKQVLVLVFLQFVPYLCNGVVFLQDLNRQPHK
jgi:hypothetical protein